MINKKGFLLAEETLKIIIAIIVILFLVYFLISLYYNSKNDKDLKIATASLDHLINEVNNGNSEVEIYNPKGWHFLSWPAQGLMPNYCSNLGFERCLCLCKGPGILEKGLVAIGGSNIIGEFLTECNSNGYCVESDYRVSGGSIEISNPPIVLEVDGGSIRKK